MSASTRLPVGLEIEVLRGDAVLRVLEDGDFVRQWIDLFSRCAWSTAYQAVDYAKAWYRCYGELYSPLLIRGFSPDQSLAGILALAVSTQDGRLVPMGICHAEYSAWLSSPERPTEFFESALDVLNTQYAGESLELGYLAPGAPIEWARSGERWARKCVIVETMRPRMELDLASIRNSLRKRSNKNRLNRLRRRGQLEFHRITDVDGLARALQVIAPQYDLRRIAVFGLQPFRDDAPKQALYLELMRSGRLHATMSTIDGRLVAAIIGVRDRTTLYLDLLCHSPMLNSESPGKLHLLALAESLAEEGYRYIDLTPGDLAWKHRSATTYDVVRNVTVALGRRVSLANKTQVITGHYTKKVIKRVFSRARLEPRSIKGAVRRLWDKGFPGIVGGAFEAMGLQLSSTAKCKRYRFARLPEVTRQGNLDVRKDALQELFLLDMGSAALNRAFLRCAYERLCAGEHFFTCTQGDRLMGLCWVKQVSNRSEPEHEASASCFVLHDPYFRPEADRVRLVPAIARAICASLLSQLREGPLDLWVRQTDREFINAFDEMMREARCDVPATERR